MNILVTGGAGYIGSNLIEVLINDPKIKKIKYLDNKKEGEKLLNELYNFEIIAEKIIKILKQ